jgi:integrase
LALAFATRHPGNSAQHQAGLYQSVRRFSEYLAIFESLPQPLDPKLLRPIRRQPPPHIYIDAELGRLLEEAGRFSPQNPIRGLTLQTMIGLAASTGLRIGEVIRLDNREVDFRAGTLTVRHTKFNKDRLVPPHPTTWDALRRYANARDLAFHAPCCEAFFLNHAGQRFKSLSLQGAFRKLVRRAGIRGLADRYPTFHHLRHTFAVRRLIAWYHDGLDVQAMLPILATYLGHVGYSETAYYLTATPELLELAQGRYQRSLGPSEAQP